jgi:ADP-heptose:LPS heptosyltransferase
LDNALQELLSLNTPYKTLKIPPSSKEKNWQAKLNDLGDGPKIGISYSGGLRKRDQIKRNLPAEYWCGLKKVKNAKFVDIQAMNLPEQRATISKGVGREIFRFAEYDPMSSIDQNLGLLQVLDGIYTVDNSNAHLAGACGLSATVILSKTADWRWGRGTNISSLYPTLKLVRKQSYSHWEELLP